MKLAPQFVGQGGIVHALCRNDAADAQGDNRKCTLTPLRPHQVGLLDFE
jgi:hypothetical protein